MIMSISAIQKIVLVDFVLQRNVQRLLNSRFQALKLIAVGDVCVLCFDDIARELIVNKHANTFITVDAQLLELLGFDRTQLAIAANDC